MEVLRNNFDLQTDHFMSVLMQGFLCFRNPFSVDEVVIYKLLDFRWKEVCPYLTNIVLFSSYIKDIPLFTLLHKVYYCWEDKCVTFRGLSILATKQFTFSSKGFWSQFRMFVSPSNLVEFGVYLVWSSDDGDGMLMVIAAEVNDGNVWSTCTVTYRLVLTKSQIHVIDTNYLPSLYNHGN